MVEGWRGSPAGAVLGAVEGAADGAVAGSPDEFLGGWGDRFQQAIEFGAGGGLAAVEAFSGLRSRLGGFGKSKI